MAAQLTATKGLPRRGAVDVDGARRHLLAVPLSPVSSTVARLPATSPICSMTRRKAGLVPISCSKPGRPSISERQPGILAHRVAEPQRPLDGRHDVVHLEGLRDVVEGGLP